MSDSPPVIINNLYNVQVEQTGTDRKYARIIGAVSPQIAKDIAIMDMIKLFSRNPLTGEFDGPTKENIIVISCVQLGG